MLIKRYLCMILAAGIFCSAFSVSAKNEGKKKQNKTSSRKSDSGKTEKQTAAYDKKMFDPAIPKLSKEYVTAAFTWFNKTLLAYEWPSTLKQAKHKEAAETVAEEENEEKEKGKEKEKKVAQAPTEAVSSAVLKNHIFIYKRMTMHPDLEEVTKTRREYFNLVGRVLNEYVFPVSELRHAVQADNAQAYQAALQRIDAASDKLDKLFREQKKYQLTAAELKKIKADNYARRKVEIEKLMKKLGVDKNGKPLKKKQGQTAR